MMSSIYYGKIKEERLATWQDNSEPYDILVDNHEIHRVGGWSFLDYANANFSDKVQVDWGSFAYKCSGKQLKKFQRKTLCEIEKIENVNDEEIYGVVFIELY
ncbi:MAG: hypothetical protein GX567_17385 [Clostridia bacterium]|nr:hypothetical protein [Clostridia bacterium]